MVPELFDVAIGLDGNLAPAHAYRGFVEIPLGRAEAAEQHVARAMRLSPRDPMYPTWQLVFGIDDLYLGRLDDAVGHLRQSVALNRNCGWAQGALAVALALRDQDDEQVTSVSAEARRMAPSFTVAKFRSEALGCNPIYLSQRERLVAGLQRIGMPEE